MFNGLQMLMQKELLVLNDNFLCLNVCVFRNSCELYNSLLFSFMEFMKPVVCAKPPLLNIYLCSIESLKIGERKISSNLFRKVRLEIPL